MPARRATSTSTNCSIVYELSPSTSDGSMPASSSAAVMARHAIVSSDSGSALANAVCPIPTIAVRSFMGGYSPSLELRGAALDEAAHALGRVLGHVVELLGVPLVPERPVAVGLEGPVGEPLGEADGPGGRR